MKNQLLVIDAYSQIFRMFYGIRGDMKSPDGFCTNAIYGIARLLFTLDRDIISTHSVVAFDKGKCFTRTKIQKDYKANRASMPEELREQVPYIREWFEYMGWNIFEKEGVEADDIIATCVKNSTLEKNLILSSDKDLMQLITPDIMQLIPGKQGTFSIFSPADVVEKFNVMPNQVLDYLAIIGDSADNIPGIAGVGPKTAAKLLNEFGSIETLINQSHKIANNKLREKITSSATLLKQNQQMIALYPELFSWPGLNHAQRKPVQTEKLFELATNLGFKSMLNEIDNIKKLQDSPMLFNF